MSFQVGARPYDPVISRFTPTKKGERYPRFLSYGHGNASSHTHGSCKGWTTRLVKMNQRHGSTYFTFTVSTFMLLILIL